MSRDRLLLQPWESVQVCVAFVPSHFHKCISLIVCFLAAGPSEGKDERRAQQASVGHGGQTPHRVQRASAAAPEGEDGGSGGEGPRWPMETSQHKHWPVNARTEWVFCFNLWHVLFCFSLFSSQNLLIQDSENYRKQYEESIQEKVGCRNDGEIILDCSVCLLNRCDPLSFMHGGEQWDLFNKRHVNLKKKGNLSVCHQLAVVSPEMMRLSCFWSADADNSCIGTLSNCLRADPAGRGDGQTAIGAGPVPTEGRLPHRTHAVSVGCTEVWLVWVWFFFFSGALSDFKGPIFWSWLHPGHLWSGFAWLVIQKTV